MPVNGWQEKPIGDLFASSLPGDWGSEGDAETGVPVLRSTNFVDDGSIDYTDIAFRSVAKARLEKRKIGVGTILVEKAGGSSTRPAGRVVYCDREFNGTASNFVEVVHVKQEFDPRFVFYRLFYNFHAGLVYKYQQQTTGIINFKLREYGAEIVDLPDTKYEQAKIAEILSTVDMAIEQTEALIAKQQRIKTGLMQDLLTRGIDEHGNLRSDQTHKFKDSPSGRIPAEWDVRNLSKSTSRLITYGIVQPGPNRSEGVPFVQTKDLMKGVLDTDKMDRTSHEIHAAYHRSAISFGDVLVGIRASVGSVVQVPAELDGANISRGVARLSPSSGIVARFLYWTVQSARCQKAIALQIKGSTYPEITLPALREVMIPIPLPAEQALISTVLDHAAKNKTETEGLLAKLRCIKTALMQDLLTGRRRVTSLLSEPLEAIA